MITVDEICEFGPGKEDDETDLEELPSLFEAVAEDVFKAVFDSGFRNDGDQWKST